MTAKPSLNVSAARWSLGLWCRQGRSSCPVLQPQPLDPLELAHVVGHQHQALAACVSGDVQVIHPDGRSFALQIGPYVALMRGCLVVIGEHHQP